MKRPRLQLGLIGYPLEHSLSPHMHRSALRALGLDGEYHLYPIPPGSKRLSTIRELLDRMRIDEIHGLNVTVPLKQAVIPFVDTLTPTAKTVGAVNTIYFSDGGLVGDNSDVPGFWADLSRQQISFNNSPSTALVLGAGGAARAVVYALDRVGWQVIVAARRLVQAQELVAALLQSVKGEGSSFQGELTVGRRHDLRATRLSSNAIDETLLAMDSGSRALTLIVNATPMGMLPETNTSPWPLGLRFPRQAFVYDLVYNPAETLLMKQARQAGLPSTNGLGMLVEQAALSFERWTGVAAPRAVMRGSIMQKQG